MFFCEKVLLLVLQENLMKYFLGLDLSVSACGCVLMGEDGGVLESGVWGWKLTRDATVKEKVERLIYISSEIVNVALMAKDLGELFVSIENYAFGARGAQNDLGEIHGAVKTQLYLGLGVYPEMVSPASARKTVLGKGRFSKGMKGKREIVSAVRERGFNVSDHNIADAWVIAEFLRTKTKEMEDVEG